MTEFEIRQIDKQLVPILHWHPDEVLLALQEAAAHGGAEIEMRMGAVYERKDYPQVGPVARVLDSSPYRRGSEDIIISVVLLLGRDPWMPERIKQLVSLVQETEIEADKERARKALQEKKDRIDSLREQADRLEAELKKETNQ